jgi:hypothetical protein
VYEFSDYCTASEAMNVAAMFVAFVTADHSYLFGKISAAFLTVIVSVSDSEQDIAPVAIQLSCLINFEITTKLQ